MFSLAPATFEVDDFAQLVAKNISSFKAYEQKIIYEALKICKNKQDFWLLYQYLSEPQKWRYPMVSVDTFLDHDNFLGRSTKNWRDIFPWVRTVCRDIVEGWYLEWVEVAGIGTGKSFSAQVLACYAAHHLLCLKDAHGSYSIAKDKPIAIINMGTTATQAAEVVFAGIKKFISNSEFFSAFKPEIQATSIRFKEQDLLMVSGNSKATTPLGYNVFYAIMDEAAFYMDNEQKSVAREIYESLQRRIVSRFWKSWLLMMISSPNYMGDFIMQKLREARLRDENWELINKHIYSMQMPSWKWKNLASLDFSDKFFFDHRSNKIVTLPNPEDKVNYITTKDFGEEYDVWEVPWQYKASFKSNPEKAKRDFAAVPTESISTFFTNTEIVRGCWNTLRLDPVKLPWVYKFEEYPLRVPYYIHVDIGLNKNGMGDHTGFAMGHFWGWIKDDELWTTQHMFVIDLVERIWVQGSQTEVPISEIRSRIFRLRDMGYRIAWVTFDWFASQDTIQILKRAGINSEYLSVDRTMDAYNTLKEAIFTRRFDCYFQPQLEHELVRLEDIEWKVDHPLLGSKDLADAVAWVVQNIFLKTPKWASWVANADSRLLKEDPVKKEEAKIKRLEKLQRIVNRQDEEYSRMIQTKWF